MKGRCLNRLTKGPHGSLIPYGIVPAFRRTPRVGLEPTTLRLTAECSTIELSRIIYTIQIYSYQGNSPNALPLSYRGLYINYAPSKLHTKYHIFLSKSRLSLNLPSGQAFDRLVTVSSMHYCTSTSVLSTSFSLRGLGISHLEGGFTLRCLQRLSLPDTATRR